MLWKKDICVYIYASQPLKVFISLNFLMKFVEALEVIYSSYRTSLQIFIKQFINLDPNRHPLFSLTRGNPSLEPSCSCKSYGITLFLLWHYHVLFFIYIFPFVYDVIYRSSCSDPDEMHPNNLQSCFGANRGMNEWNLWYTLFSHSFFQNVS